MQGSTAWRSNAGWERKSGHCRVLIKSIFCHNDRKQPVESKTRTYLRAGSGGRAGGDAGRWAAATAMLS